MATRRQVGEDAEGQRLDNYLVKILKGVPKSHVYRIVRGGEVRVNSKRVAPDYRLQEGDELRLPPVRKAEKFANTEMRPALVKADAKLEDAILYEDDAIIALNKPAGLAVHGGSGVSSGVIEQLRVLRNKSKFIELVHRLDRDTSGILLLAKKRSALTALHTVMRGEDGGRDGNAGMQKQYLVLVKGRWKNAKQHVKLALRKHVLPSGERRVSVAEDGQASHTIFTLEQKYADYSLLRAELKTGRTHQIRVHLAYLGFPIVGDDKYGDFVLNKELIKKGFKRMFLHAAELSFAHPLTGEPLALEAPLPEALSDFLETLNK